MSFFTYTITSPISKGTQTIAAQLNTFFASVGSINIVDLRAAIFQTERNGCLISVTICYDVEQGAALYNSVCIFGLPAYDVDTQVGIWITNNPTAQLARVLDVTPPDEAQREAVILIYTTGSSTNTQQTLLLVKNGASPVATLASGSMAIQNSAGATGSSITVYNNSGVSWPANGLGYASFDPTSGNWVGTIL